MEKPIDLALKEAVAAHEENNLQKARQLYDAILKAQPDHPDANHNLGLLAAAAGNVTDALPLFKKALEANPSETQFWLSYIEGLIKTSSWDDVKKALADAKQAGLNKAQIVLLEKKLQANLQNDPTPNTKVFAASDKHRKRFENGQKKKIVCSIITLTM